MEQYLTLLTDEFRTSYRDLAAQRVRLEELERLGEFLDDDAELDGFSYRTDLEAALDLASWRLRAVFRSLLGVRSPAMPADLQRVKARLRPLAAREGPVAARVRDAQDRGGRSAGEA